ncbi:putative RNA helicase [Medicago truncatula]|nr:putative RNA helicase [Medicago truncatula]
MRRPTATKAKREQQAVDDQINNHHNRNNKEDENNLAECKHKKKLGSKKPKMRVTKPSEKFRFTFDWENTEDLYEDLNILYHNPDEARRLFGRGFRGRMDRCEQEKLAAKNFKEMHDQIKNKDDSIGGEAFNDLLI